MEFNFSIFQYYNYDLIDKQAFTAIIMQAVIVFGILSNIIFTPFCAVAPTLAKKQFLKLYPDEKILYITKSPFLSRFIVFFLSGAFFAMCIYSFIAFKNLDSYLKIHRTLFFLYVLIYLIATHWLIFFRYSMTYILSDKGIRMLLPYKFSSVYKGKFYGALLPYNAISSIKEYSILTTKFIEIYLKEGCTYLNNKKFNGLCGFNNINQIKNIINDRIKGEKNERC